MLDSGVGVLKNEGKSFTIHGLISNRCEMFAGITKGIQTDKDPVLTLDASRFFNNIQDLNNTDYDELLQKSEQMVIGMMFSTASKELVKYREMKNWSIFDKFLAKLLPKKRKENREKKELENKLEKWQNDYKEPLKELVKVNELENRDSDEKIEEVHKEEMEESKSFEK